MTVPGYPYLYPPPALRQSRAETAADVGRVAALQEAETDPVAMRIEAEMVLSKEAALWAAPRAAVAEDPCEDSPDRAGGRAATAGAN